MIGQHAGIANLAAIIDIHPCRHGAFIKHTVFRTFNVIECNRFQITDLHHHLIFTVGTGVNDNIASSGRHLKGETRVFISIHICARHIFSV